ncbi:hypothetical protein [Nitrosopumilus sp. S6]
MPNSSYWDPVVFEKNANENLKHIDLTINDFDFSQKKVMICGKGEYRHPEFHPRFSTPSTNIDSELYVLVDHTQGPLSNISKKGNYALSIIVDPKIPEKIQKLDGKIFWFSPTYIPCNLPKIISGEFPKFNSGLTCISLASFFNVELVLLSGIKLTGEYSQFLKGKDIVFKNIQKTKIFSLDGILAKKISFDDWLSL